MQTLAFIRPPLFLPVLLAGLLLSSVVFTGCNPPKPGEKRLPRVIANKDRQSSKTKPATPTENPANGATAQPNQTSDNISDKTSDKKGEGETKDGTAPAKDTIDPTKTDGQNPESEKDASNNDPSDKEAKTNAASTDKDKPPVKTNRSAKLPNNFLLAEDILLSRTTDPFMSPAASKLAANPTPAGEGGVMTASTAAASAHGKGQAHAPANGQPGGKPAPADNAPAPLPEIKYPVVSVKGIVTGINGAMALLTDDAGHTQTVRPGQMTYLTLLPSKVVAINKQQVVLENLMTKQRSLLPIPNIVGFRPDGNGAGGGGMASGGANRTPGSGGMNTLQQAASGLQANRQILNDINGVTTPSAMGGGTTSDNPANQAQRGPQRAVLPGYSPGYGKAAGGSDGKIIVLPERPLPPASPSKPGSTVNLSGPQPGGLTVEGR